MDPVSPVCLTRIGTLHFDESSRHDHWNATELFVALLLIEVRANPRSIHNVNKPFLRVNRDTAGSLSSSRVVAEVNSHAEGLDLRVIRLLPSHSQTDNITSC